MNAKTRLPVIRGLARNTILEHPYAPILVVLVYFSVTGLLYVSAALFSLGEGLWPFILYQIITLLMQAMICVFDIGRKKYFVDLGEKDQVPVLTLFAAFRGNVRTVLGAAFFLMGIRFLFTLPAVILSFLNPISPENIKESAVILGLMALGNLFGYLATVPFFPVLYLIGDFKSMPLGKALRMSLWLMKGNFFRYIGFCISLIPLSILGYLSLGFGFLWITPLIQSSYAHFYLDLLKQKKK
ncbi:MAG: DUF975 family protein [Lachnospiraceae bacterium]|nr:DUF975 family protein [Lachnospiraceae bacterium]